MHNSGSHGRNSLVSAQRLPGCPGRGTKGRDLRLLPLRPDRLTLPRLLLLLACRWARLLRLLPLLAHRWAGLRLLWLARSTRRDPRPLLLLTLLRLPLRRGIRGQHSLTPEALDQFLLRRAEWNGR